MQTLASFTTVDSEVGGLICLQASFLNSRSIDLDFVRVAAFTNKNLVKTRVLSDQLAVSANQEVKPQRKKKTPQSQ